MTQASPAKVVVVDDTNDVIDVLESLVDPGSYDIKFTNSDRAFSCILATKPGLIIVCTRVDGARGSQVLTMLQLDPRTREIPTLICITETEYVDWENGIVDLEDDIKNFLPAYRHRTLN